MQDSYTIRDLEQVRLLADPLKLRLLQAFAENEKTTKQVAAELGESVTKLYRHVDALHAGGLLEIVRKTPKRGTIERVFCAVAHRFEADRSIFSKVVDEDDLGAFRNLLDAGQEEILQALESAGTEQVPDDIILLRLRIKGSPQRIAALRGSLADWIESVTEDDEEDSADLEEVGALIAFYPIHEDWK